MKIEFFSDMVCPWCRIGMQQLQEALASWQGEAVELIYRAYILDPDVPMAGDSFRERMIERKGISDEHLEKMVAHVTEAGKQAGVTFRFDQLTVAPNTRYAHQLMAIADEDLKKPLFDAITEAYFERNINIGLPHELTAIAERIGMNDAASIPRRLEQEEGWIDVLRDVREARSLKITGVPYYIINEKYSVSGARPAQHLLKAMDWALKQDLGVIR